MKTTMTRRRTESIFASKVNLTLNSFPLVSRCSRRYDILRAKNLHNPKMTFVFFFSLQVFDMKKFQQNMNRELKRPYPDRRKLEAQCISAVAFGNATNAGAEVDILDCPVWIICINIVAIEMLRAKLPPRKSLLYIIIASPAFLALDGVNELSVPIFAGIWHWRRRRSLLVPFNS